MTFSRPKLNEMDINASRNISDNISVAFAGMPRYVPSSWIIAVTIMRSVCVPVIVVVGLFGNTLTLLVFSAKSMKTSACSVFLASLALVDSTFLLCLLITWADGEIQVILSCNTTCQLLIFMTYVTSFLSVWFIVGFTCERFIAICFPLKCHYVCSVFREKIIVGLLTLTAFAMYNFSFWTTGMQQWGPTMRCSHKIEYFEFLNVITWIDTFLTMVVPFLLVVTMNSFVIRVVMKCALSENSTGKNDRLRRMASMTRLLSTNTTTRTANRVKFRVGAQRQNPQFRVTRTLLFVSSTFLVLNLPSHSIRLYNLISSVASDNPTVTEQFYFLQELTLMFYYSTFSCNFFLYTLFGRNFKKSLILILRCRPTTESARAKLLRRYGSSHGSYVTST